MPSPSLDPAIGATGTSATPDADTPDARPLPASYAPVCHFGSARPVLASRKRARHSSSGLTGSTPTSGLGPKQVRLSLDTSGPLRSGISPSVHSGTSGSSIDHISPLYSSHLPAVPLQPSSSFIPSSSLFSPPGCIADATNPTLGPFAGPTLASVPSPHLLTSYNEPKTPLRAGPGPPDRLLFPTGPACPQDPHQSALTLSTRALLHPITLPSQNSPYNPSSRPKAPPAGTSSSLLQQLDKRAQEIEHSIHSHQKKISDLNQRIDSIKPMPLLASLTNQPNAHPIALYQHSTPANSSSSSASPLASQKNQTPHPPRISHQSNRTKHSVSPKVGSIKPKPRPTLPSRTIDGFPLRSPSPGHDPAIAKAVVPVGLQPSADILEPDSHYNRPTPRRGNEAHRVTFLLNPTMNPAQEHIRNLTPPPESNRNRASRNMYRERHSGGDHPGSLEYLSEEEEEEEEEENDDGEEEDAQEDEPYKNAITKGDSNHASDDRNTIKKRLDAGNQKPGQVDAKKGGQTRRKCKKKELANNQMKGFVSTTVSNSSCFQIVKPRGLIKLERVSKAEIIRYVEIFFSKYSNRLTWSKTEKDRINSIKGVSDLLLTAIVSVVTNVEQNYSLSSEFINEAKTWTRCTLFPSRRYEVEDLKGIMTLAIYHGLHSICAHFVTLCLQLQLDKVWVKLTDPNIRGKAPEEDLVQMGRTWLTVVIYSHLFCVFSNKMYLVCSPRKVIEDHAKILLTSDWSEECDILIQAHVELVMVLAHAQDKLDYRNYSGPIEKRKSKHVFPQMGEVLDHLNQWINYWKIEAPQLVSVDEEEEKSWTDASSGYNLTAKKSSCLEKEHSVGTKPNLRNPQRHIYLYIMRTAVWPCQNGTRILMDKEKMSLALSGCRYAADILDQALGLKEAHKKANSESKQGRTDSDNLDSSAPEACIYENRCSNHKVDGCKEGSEDETRHNNIGLPIEIEYEKVTMGLAVGFLLWICQVIPGRIPLKKYRALLGRLHRLEFNGNCEYHDVIEETMNRVDVIMKIEENKNKIREEGVIEDKTEGYRNNDLEIEMEEEDNDEDDKTIKIGRSLSDLKKRKTSTEINQELIEEEEKADEEVPIGPFEYQLESGIGKIEDEMSDELDRLMTDTRFWFQVDIDPEFKTPDDFYFCGDSINL